MSIDDAAEHPVRVVVHDFQERFKWAYHKTELVGYIQPGYGSKEADARKHIAAVDLGSTLSLMRASAILSVLSQSSLLLLAVLLSACTDGGYACYPAWLWLSLLPAVAFKIFTEWKALKYASIITAVRIGFKVVGVQTGFLLWLAFYASISQANIADIGSDSLFTGTAIVSLRCSDNMLQMLWERQWNESLLAKAKAPAPSLLVMVTTLWLFSLVQMIWPICRTWPKSGFRGGGARMAIGEIEFSSRKACIPGCSGDDFYGHMWQDEEFFAAADAAGMATITCLSIPFGGDETSQYAALATDAPDNVFFIIQTVAAAVKLRHEVFERMLLSHIGENSLQLNMQASLYMLSCAIAKQLGSGDAQPVQIQALFSLVIGVSMTFLKLAEAKDVFDAAHFLFEHPQSRRFLGEDSIEGERLRIQMQRLSRLGIKIMLCCVILTMSLVYAVAKIVMAHVCESSLWNISSGCTDYQ